MARFPLLLAAASVLALQFVDAVPISARLVGRQNGRQRQSQTGGQRTGQTGNSNNAANSLPATDVATDGSLILEDEVTINGLQMRFKVSGPQEAFVANGAANGQNRRQATMGINVLFHGDGGQSFVDFPNQGVQNGLMGVALLAPDENFRWGGVDPQDQTGLVRPDGEAHSEAVNAFITQELPNILNFDQSQIFMEGISGGSLMLSGFTLPLFATSLGVQGAVLGCGGLEPQVNVQGDISNVPIHFQSTTDELAPLQTSIPQAIVAYEGLSNTVTADASPNGGHCEFDEQDFVSGVQLLTDNFSDILAGNGQLNGVAVSNNVQGQEDLFGNGAVAANANANQQAANQAGNANQQGTANQATGNTRQQTGGTRQRNGNNRRVSSTNFAAVGAAAGNHRIGLSK